MTRDDATVRKHKGIMAGHSGYRYANHPATKGPVRGPDPPFTTANKPWAPEEDHPDGPHSQKNLEQAVIGAYREGSSEMLGASLRKNRSLPSITRTLKLHPPDEDGRHLGERAKEAANPLSIELNRWERLSEITKRDSAGMPELDSWKKPERS